MTGWSQHITKAIDDFQKEYPEEATPKPLFLENMDLDEQIAILRYADDLVLLSKIHCEECLHRIVLCPAPWRAQTHTNCHTKAASLDIVAGTQCSGWRRAARSSP